MKAATIVLLLALGALALAHRDGGDNRYKKKDHDHDRYNHHSSSSSSSSPEHRYRHRENRHKYKRDTAAVTPLPAASTTTMLPAATTTLPLTTTVAPKGRQADAIVSTTALPIPATTTLATTTLAATTLATTTLAAKGRQADFISASTSTTEMPTSVPSVIGKPIQTSQDCDFSCKFFTLVNAENGTPVSFNYRTSPTCLQVDAFCEAGFTLVTYGSFAPVPLDSADNGHGIINCFNSTWFDMNGDSGSNVMCINDANVNHLFTSTTPVSSSDVITEAVPIEQTTTMLPFAPEAVPMEQTKQTTTMLPFAPEAVPMEQTMQTTTMLPFAPIRGSNTLAPMTTH
jgi:hypothetical protein